MLNHPMKLVLGVLAGLLIVPAITQAQMTGSFGHYGNFSSAQGAPAHYFRLMKELTLFGYFTSEIGCTQAMRYRETPGRFDPCVPYTPGDPAWAPHA